MRPFAGVIDRAAEFLASPEGRTVRRRQAADSHDAELRGDIVSAVGFDAPGSRGLVVSGRCDARVKPDVLAEIETVGDMVGVAEDLGLRRVLFRPVPLLVQLFGK